MTLTGVPATTRRIPGEAGIWVFVLGDMAVFALFFGTFMYSRGRNPSQFISGHGALSVAMGTVNTVVLLTSSLLVALGVSRLAENRAGARRLFGGALGCGLVFVLIKVAEWTHLFAGGITVGTSEYFSYYYMFTGIHLGHVVIGLIILARLCGVAGRGALDVKQRRFVEIGGIFWHMVDLLWVVLFALFYLVR
ncbi:cytochrome c oxidase subunit 3 [Mycolicibacterium neoaurum]|uniref:cytochrome c oxidase subunit 3 n=1 Tax=Mycolicibacterium neoaurum TaxID=1795 RepID=UPI00248AAB50|nr:cytochrome c oxidase subunit 3 [Mycolicibacterium neoaurum]WBP95832.1 cytochrome c oxidase subunit 3 [Mycolicibacterium neoaurum]WBS09517.1 cytochrome c oxidase subunit 3 [Mycolicibacterium neoaurum]